MRKDFLKFIFEDSMVEDTPVEKLGQDIIHLFEKAEKTELEALAPCATDLKKVLKEIGVCDSCLSELDGCEFPKLSGDLYREIRSCLACPEGLSALADKGWIVAFNGDKAQSAEPEEFSIQFVKVGVAETGDSEKPEDAEKLRKQAQKDASEEFERSGSNPVELDGPIKTGKRVGVGEPADGKKPEGKVKGISDSRSSDDIVNSLLEVTMASSVPAVESGATVVGPFAKKKKVKKNDQ